MSRNYKLGIIGHGFVGKAVDFGFSKDIEKKIIDPLYNTTVSDLEEFNPQAVFVSVPTPMGKDGSIDASIILSVALDIAKLSCKPIMIVKSTVTPDVLKKIEKIYSRLVYNPEFMRERNYEEDFVNPPMHVFGGETDLCKEVQALYENHSVCRKTKVYYCDIVSASMIKYTLNSFLATKVLFFNQLKDIYDAAGAKSDWKLFTEMVSTDPRIGKSHMDVPGPDGRKGFGGACFAKDSAAFLSFALSVDAQFKLLEKATKYNRKIRNQYDELDVREKAQNVKYD